MKKMRVALIAGGKSAEREVSLKSGDQVYQALNKDKYEIRRYDPLHDLERLVREAPETDVALIIMHGRGGGSRPSWSSWGSPTRGPESWPRPWG